MYDVCCAVLQAYQLREVTLFYSVNYQIAWYLFPTKGQYFRLIVYRFFCVSFSVFVVFKKTMLILSKSGQVKNAFYFNYFFDGKNTTRFLHSIYIHDLKLFLGCFLGHIQKSECGRRSAVLLRECENEINDQRIATFLAPLKSSDVCRVKDIQKSEYNICSMFVLLSRMFYVCSTL